jgi:hypothetical protein
LEKTGGIRKGLKKAKRLKGDEKGKRRGTWNERKC